MMLGLGLSISSPQPAGESGPATPAEWIGQTPLVDWDVASAVVTSGTDIDSIPNAGTGGSDLTGVASNKPQLIASDADFNGHPSAEHADATAQRFTFTGMDFSSGGPLTVYMVMLSDRVSGNAYALSIGDRLGFLNSAGTPQVFLSANGAAVASNDNNPATPAIWAGQLDSGTQRIYVSSATQDASGASTGLTDGNGTVGIYAGSQVSTFVLGGRWARVLVFADSHDATERAAVMAALGTKYGISIT